MRAYGKDGFDEIGLVTLGPSDPGAYGTVMLDPEELDPKEKGVHDVNICLNKNGEAPITLRGTWAEIEEFFKKGLEMAQKKGGGFRVNDPVDEFN